jgi:hypothetical protein
VRVKVGALALQCMAEKYFSRQARRGNPLFLQEIGALLKGSLDRQDTNLSGAAFFALFFQLLGLVIRGQGVDNGLQPSFNNEIELVES